MRVVDRSALDDGRQRITLVPESVDDLWHLKYVIEPGDLVYGETTRRIHRQDDALRDTGGEREHLSVTISVDEVEFHRFATRLRIAGLIESSSREDQIGHHHTLNVEVFDEIGVEKRFKPDQLQRLEEAEEATDQPDVVIVTVEEGQAHVHSVAQYGTDEHATIRGATGKGEYAQDRSALFDELADVVERLDADAIILAGPGFTKQDAFEHIVDREPSVADRIHMVDTSAVGDRGVHEVLSRGTLEDVQTQTRLATEASLLDRLMTALRTDDPVAYGIGDVAKAAEYGAVEHLLVTDERLRRERADAGEWSTDVDAVLTAVDRQGGEITVFSSEFEPAQQLENLGGIAALLRYRID